MDGSLAKPQNRSRPLSDRFQQIRQSASGAIATRIIVFGDNDPNYTGQSGAYALARRLGSEERLVEVQIPAEVGADWNDVHQLQLARTG